MIKDGFNKHTNRDQNFITFCDELRAYIEGHHLMIVEIAKIPEAIKAGKTVKISKGDFLKLTL